VKCELCGYLNKSKGACQVCGSGIAQPDAPKKYWIPKKSKKGKEVTKKDLEFFKEIWNERPHVCEVSGQPLLEFNPSFFSHVLTKAAYPKFRHNKKNIVLCSLEYHNLWERTDRKDPLLKWVVELEEELKREYYKS
jgi:hypothetical protein